MHANLSLSHLKFRHLLLITHLVELGNLHKAAQYLNISQPAASAMLKEFENQVGLLLFDRTNQGVIATAAAIELARRAETILNEFNAFVRDTQRLGKSQSTLLRVGVVPHALSAYLPRAIELYREAGSGAVTIQEGTAKHLVQQLHEGKLDCVIGRLSAASLPTMRDTDDLRFHLLYSERICIVEGTAKKKTKNASYSDLANREWVLTQPDSSLRLQLTDLFFRHGLVLPEPVIETTNYFQSLTMLSQSSLCSVVPQSAAEMHVKLGNIRVIDTPAELTPMPVSFISKASAEGNVHIVQFREIFASLSKQ